MLLALTIITALAGGYFMYYLAKHPEDKFLGISGLVTSIGILTFIALTYTGVL